MELRAQLHAFAEGCRGSLTKTLFERFKLRDGVEPQTYGIGIKELWEIEPAQHAAGPGRPHHRLAARPQTYGGSFLYIWRATWSRSASWSGSTTRTPILSPFEEIQRFKTHPGDPRRSSRAAGASPTARGR